MFFLITKINKYINRLFVNRWNVDLSPDSLFARVMDKSSFQIWIRELAPIWVSLPSSSGQILLCYSVWAVWAGLSHIQLSILKKTIQEHSVILLLSLLLKIGTKMILLIISKRDYFSKSDGLVQNLICCTSSSTTYCGQQWFS